MTSIEFNDYCIANNIEKVKEGLADTKLDINHFGGNPFLMASAMGNLEIIKLLLEDERTLTASNDNHAFQFATVNQRKDIVDLMVEHPNMDLGKDKNKLYYWCLNNTRKDGVEYALKKLKECPNVLATAIEYKQREIVSNDSIDAFVF